MAAPQTNANGDGRNTGLLAYLQRSLDRMAPPASRQRGYDDVSAFAAARPVLFASLISQLLFSLLPLLLFTTFAVSTAATAFAAAAVFSIFWVAVAFVVLVPALLLAASAALLFWAWVVGAFLAARWLYRRVPFAAVEADGHSGGDDDAWAKRVVLFKDGQGQDGEVKYTKQEQ